MDLPLWPPALAVCLGLIGCAWVYVASKRYDRRLREEERAGNVRPAE